MTCTSVNCVTSFLTSVPVLSLFNMGLQAIHVYGLGKKKNKYMASFRSLPDASTADMAKATSPHW